MGLGEKGKVSNKLGHLRRILGVPLVELRLGNCDMIGMGLGIGCTHRTCGSFFGGQRFWNWIELCMDGEWMVIWLGRLHFYTSSF